MTHTLLKDIYLFAFPEELLRMGTEEEDNLKMNSPLLAQDTFLRLPEVHEIWQREISVVRSWLNHQVKLKAILPSAQRYLSAQQGYGD